MRLQRVPYEEGDAPAFSPGPPAERGKEKSEYQAGARSAILASSPAGCSQVSVSSMMSMLMSRMKVDTSDYLLNVPTDLALKRQKKSMFSAEEEPGSLGGDAGGTAVVSC